MNFIEKQFIQNIKYYDNNFGFNKNKKNTKKDLDISNSDYFFFKNIQNSTISVFDKIYSHFFLFQKNNNNFCNEDEKDEKSSNIINCSQHNSQQKLNKNKIDELINFPISANNVTDRLYNSMFFTKAKLDRIRRIRDINFKKQLIPKITIKGKKIKGDKKRLYNDTIINNMRKVLSQKNILEKDKSCSFKPNLNKNSLKIAEKLEPSSSRLNKKLININKDEIFDLTKQNYSNLFGNKVVKKYNKNDKNANKKLNKSTEEIEQKIEDFYQRQLKTIKDKEKLYNENLIKKENEFQKYPFHPIINHSKNDNSINKTYINENMNTFERLYKTNKTNHKKKSNFNE